MKRQYFIGIDLGGTYTKIALVGGSGKVIAKTTLKTFDYKRNELINAIIAAVKKIISAKHLRKRDISAIGMGLPGLIDSRKGIVRYLVNVPGWKDVTIKKIMETRLGIKTYIDNDVNAMTLGEFYYGAAKGAKNVVCLTLGTGIGGGIIIDGRLYRGTDLVAGEIGHIPINEEGPRCNCGGIACIEAYIGNRHLMRKLRNDIKKKPMGILKSKDTRLTLEVIDKAAKKGNKLAIRFWKEVAARLGVMLTGVINFMNPEKIVIGGGVANAGKFLFDPLKATVKKRAMRIQSRSAKIVKANLGEDAGVIGAAVLARIEN